MQKTKRTEKRKKLPLRVLLMYLLLCTVVMSGVTFSRYISTASGGDEGRVAKFHASADVSQFDDEFTVTMDPQGSKPYKLEVMNDSETAVEITATLETDGNLPLKFTYRIGEDDTVPAKDMTPEDGADGSVYTFTESLKPNETGKYTIILSWNENSDEYSYSNGVASVRLHVKAEQID